MKRGGGLLPGDVARARRRFEEWRRTRPRLGPIPEPLWSEATSLARRHGVWGVSRALRLNYDRLKERVATAKNGVPDADPVVTFVEVGRADAAAVADTRGGEIELTSADGARLVIRVPHGVDVDHVRLAEAFWSRRA